MAVNKTESITYGNYIQKNGIYWVKMTIGYAKDCQLNSYNFVYCQHKVENPITH